MKSESALRSARQSILARLNEATANIKFAKQARQLAIVNYGVDSTAEQFWDAEEARHIDEWMGLRFELREIDQELNG